MADRQGAGHVRVAALCALVVGFDGFDSQALAFAAPALSRAWHLAPGALGPVFGAALSGMMIGALALGTLADRYGRRRMILLGVVIFALGALATLATGNLQQLLAVRFITGIGLGGVLPNAVALTAEHAPARLRATLVMVMFSALSIGAALGGLLASVIIARFGWASVFVAGGVMPLLALPALLRGLPESPALAKFEKPGLPLPQLFRDGRGGVTALLWGVFFLNLLDIFFLNNWLPTLFNAASLAVGAAILITVMFQLGGAIGSYVLSRLIFRFGFVPVLAANFLLGGAAIFVLGRAGAAIVLLVPASFLAGGCVIGGQAGCNALAGDYYPAYMRGTGVGWALGIGRIGSIIGPVLGGIMLAAHWPVAQLFFASAVPQICAALLIVGIGFLPAWRARKEH